MGLKSNLLVRCYPNEVKDNTNLNNNVNGMKNLTTIGRSILEATIIITFISLDMMALVWIGSL